MGNITTKVKVLKWLAVLRVADNGWTQELSIASWYGKEPKIDIRWWSPDKTETGKGTTLRLDEWERLREVIMDLPNDLNTLDLIKEV